MTDAMVGEARLQEILEQAASALVLAGPTDLQALAQVHGWLDELAGALPSSAATTAAAAAAATTLLGQVILSEVPDPGVALDVIGRTVAALQAVLCEGRDPAGVELPVELGVAAGDAVVRPALPEGMCHPGSLPSHVEPAIYAEFLGRQGGVLEEIEAAVLAIEAGNDEGGEKLASLRRHVHTVKGESALLGLHEVERLCHAIEDALQARPASTLVQLLLEARDWLTQMFAFCRGVCERPGQSGELLAAYHNGAAGAPAAPPAPASGRRVEPAPSAAAGPPVADAAAAATTAVPLSGDPSLLGEFVSEAREHLDAAEGHLLALEADPRQDDALNGIFRAFHTIKGVAGFLGLDDIGHLAHEAENLLDRARKGKLTLAGPAIEVTFAAVDLMKRLVEALRAALESGAGLVPEPQLPALLANLRAVSAGETPPAAVADAAPVPAADPAPATAPVADAAEGRGGAARAAAPAAQGVTVKEAVKVDADRLDRLVDAIGELVIAESMVSQSLVQRAAADGELARQLGLLDKITRELQEMATSLRMVPIKATFQKMARLARDLSVKAGKPVEFVVSGEDTELDKTVVDRIGDPLVHMVRNAVDHGLEASVEARRQAGKPDKGRVDLRAYHRGGNIYVEISDDGRGLDRAAILAKGIERGLVREGEALSDREIYNLIFQPGFSTAKKITEVSGRGVGMDVVRRSIEALRGAVEIRSEAGRGSTFAIRLPLTLAIIDGMIVRVGHERYIVPTLSIVRTVQPAPGDVASVLGRGEMLSAGGKLLPLHRLGRLYGVPDAERDPTSALALVIEADGRQTALLVDELLGQQQIVIKSMGKAMQSQPGIAGGAIMPDGRVGLILDPSGLVKLAQTNGAATAASGA
ncbi:MAG: chemotaxis protein CheA [Candidatus Krumholzibacteriia bacterium]